MNKLMWIVSLGLLGTTAVPVSASQSRVTYLVIEDQPLSKFTARGSMLFPIGKKYSALTSDWYYKKVVEDLGGYWAARRVGIGKATWGIQDEFMEPRYYVPVVIDETACHELRSLKAPLFWDQQNRRVPTPKLYLPDYTQRALLAVNNNGPIYHANEKAPDEVNWGVEHFLRWDAEAQLFFVRGSMAYDYNRFVAKECR